MNPYDEPAIAHAETLPMQGDVGVPSQINMRAQVPAGLNRKEAEIYSRLDPQRLPHHIAIIMDGNGRWAKRRHLPRIAGHRSGVAAVRSTVETAARLNIPALTLYSFSAENWKRPKGEVAFLMNLLRRYLKMELPTLMENNIRLQYIAKPPARRFPILTA